MRTGYGQRKFWRYSLASSALVAMTLAAAPTAMVRASGSLSMTGFSPSSGPVGTGTGHYPCLTIN